MTITTITIGGNQYVSYASVAEADARLLVDPVRAAAWAALTADQKGVNLVAGTNRLDLEVYSGQKLVEAQPNQWLRTGALCNGVVVPDDTLPQQIEDGTIVMAGSIAIDPAASANGTAPQNIRRVGAGSAQVEFFTSQRTASFSLAASVPDAFAIIRCLLRGAGVGVGSGMASGTDGQSIFGDPNYPDLTDGFA